MVIGTLPEYRNRGIAGALAGHALRAAAEEGYDRALPRVDPFGASGVFEKTGFTTTMQCARWALEA